MCVAYNGRWWCWGQVVHLQVISVRSLGGGHPAATQNSILVFKQQSSCTLNLYGTSSFLEYIHHGNSNDQTGRSW